MTPFPLHLHTHHASEVEPRRSKRLHERRRNARISGPDPPLHALVPRRRLRKLLPHKRLQVLHVRDGVDRRGFGGRQARVRSLVPGRLLLVVDLGEPRVGVGVLLREELFGLEELGERLERRRPGIPKSRERSTRVNSDEMATKKSPRLCMGILEHQRALREQPRESDHDDLSLLRWGLRSLRNNEVHKQLRPQPATRART